MLDALETMAVRLSDDFRYILFLDRRLAFPVVGRSDMARRLTVVTPGGASKPRSSSVL
jgi:hypothetical protein